MRLFSFLKKGPGWIRGIKYALLAYIATFFLLLIPIYGWFFIQVLCTWFLLLLERIFGNVFFTASVGGDFLSFTLPNMLGWIVLLALYCYIGLFFGIIADLIRRPTAVRVLVFVVMFGSSLIAVRHLDTALSPQSLEGCEYVTDGYQAQNRSRCYLAYLEKNVSLASVDFCNKHFTRPAGGKDYHSRCLEVVAVLTKNDTICDLIPDNPGQEFDSFFPEENIQLRDKCYQEIIGTPDELSHDISPCDKRLSEAARDRCFRDVATFTKNAGICQNVVSTEIKSSCYLWVVRETGNTNLCKFVDADYRKMHTAYEELCTR